MKKLVALLMTASMLLMAGCGNDEKVIDGSGQNSAAGASQPGGNGGTVQSGQETGQTAGGKGYVFNYKGTAIEVDADAAPIVTALGEPASYYEAASCAFEGLDKIYSYNGFDMNTYPSGDKDHVSAVVFKDDSVSTAEGVCIGDSLEKVQQAYGTGGAEESGMLVYSKDNMQLCFILKDGAVISIEYRSTVLNQ